MKAFPNSPMVIILLASFGRCQAEQAASSQTSTLSPTPYSIIANDANSRIWERTLSEQGAKGQSTSQIQRYTELATGLNYQDPTTGQWVPSKEEIDFALRRVNRALNTEKLLALLHDKAPHFFEIAEVVGKWVWIQFSEKQPSEITRVLSELGFHWNNHRQLWQHPCGTITEWADYDPRKRYGSHSAASKIV